MSKLKKVLSIALSAAMVIGTVSFLPQSTWEAYADTATVKNINLGTRGFSAPTSTGSDATSWEGSKVYYGNKLWRVLDPSHDSNGAEGSAFLFSEELQGTKAYNSEYDSVTWETCTLRKYLNGTDNEGGTGTFLGDTFTAEEQSAINTTTVQNPNNSDYNTNGGNSTQDKLFLLSLEEVKKANYGFGSNSARTASSWWWLRSPGDYDGGAASVYGDGRVTSNGFTVNYGYGSVRPAFNLNLSSVLFSSASSAGKSNFESVGTDKVDTNIWKLTLKDSSKTVSVTNGESVTQSGQNVTVPYTYTGNDVSQISIMITDKAYTESDASILYYGALTTTLDGTKAGTGTFELPTSLLDGYKIYMMAEDVNDENLTDYSSAPVEIVPILAFDVTITNPANSHITLSTATSNGTETQNGLTGAITSVVYTADDGYYFPEGYTVIGSNGITVTRDSYTQITVSGTPTADASITLEAATEKESQEAPSVTDGVNKISGTTTAMEYASSESATTWTTCSDENTTVAAGTWYVRYAATDTKKAGTAASVVVTRPTPIPSTYAVTINNGTGDGSYAAGATVTITADAAPTGKMFDKWVVVSGDVKLADASKPTTTFTMPSNAVEVKATYKTTPTPTPAAPTPRLNLHVKAGATKVTLSWNKVKGADGYYIYGNKCGPNSAKKIKTIKKSDTLTWTQKNLKKGKTYKYKIQAYKKTANGTKILKTSVMVHEALTGSKYTNAKKVTANFTTATLKKGKTKQIKAKIINQNPKKKLVSHTDKFRYRTNNSKVATVSKSGKIKAVGKGKCNIYIYANNGVCKKLTITVK